MNGSDIERFYYNEDFVEKDGNDVVCEILFPFVRFSWSLSLIEFYPYLILFNQYQARYSVNNGVEYFNTIILY